MSEFCIRQEWRGYCPALAVTVYTAARRRGLPIMLLYSFLTVGLSIKPIVSYDELYSEIRRVYSSNEP